MLWNSFLKKLTNLFFLLTLHLCPYPQLVEPDRTSQLSPYPLLPSPSSCDETVEAAPAEYAWLRPRRTRRGLAYTVGSLASGMPRRGGVRSRRPIGLWGLHGPYVVDCPNCGILWFAFCVEEFPMLLLVQLIVAWWRYTRTVHPRPQGWLTCGAQDGDCKCNVWIERSQRSQEGDEKRVSRR